MPIYHINMETDIKILTASMQINKKQSECPILTKKNSTLGLRVIRTNKAKSREQLVKIIRLANTFKTPQSINPYHALSQSKQYACTAGSFFETTI